MSNPDYRAMCAELAEEVEHLWSIVRDDNNEPHSLANRARTLLDQPAAEGPTDEELRELRRQHDWPVVESLLFSIARAVLARWRRPIP